MKNYIILGLGLIFFSACNDSFMDLQPKTEISAEYFFNTEKDLQLYCYGLINTPDYDYTADQGTDDQATTDM